MQIHNVFSPDKLWLAANDSLSDQMIEFSKSVMISNNQKWEAEKILNSHLHGKKLQYWVKCVGFDNDTSWHLTSDFKDLPHQIHDFHGKYSNLDLHNDWMNGSRFGKMVKRMMTTILMMNYHEPKGRLDLIRGGLFHSVDWLRPIMWPSWPGHVTAQ